MNLSQSVLYVNKSNMMVIIMCSTSQTQFAVKFNSLIQDVVGETGLCGQTVSDFFFSFARLRPILSISLSCNKKQP